MYVFICLLKNLLNAYSMLRIKLSSGETIPYAIYLQWSLSLTGESIHKHKMTEFYMQRQKYIEGYTETENTHTPCLQQHDNMENQISLR